MLPGFTIVAIEHEIAAAVPLFADEEALGTDVSEVGSGELHATFLLRRNLNARGSSPLAASELRGAIRAKKRC
jgi:hypothetical protein